MSVLCVYVCVTVLFVTVCHMWMTVIDSYHCQFFFNTKTNKSKNNKQKPTNKNKPTNKLCSKMLFICGFLLLLLLLLPVLQIFKCLFKLEHPPPLSTGQHRQKLLSVLLALFANILWSPPIACSDCLGRTQRHQLLYSRNVLLLACRH